MVAFARFADAGSAVGLVPVIAGYGAFIVLAAAVALVLQLVSRSSASVTR